MDIIHYIKNVLVCNLNSLSKKLINFLVICNSKCNNHGECVPSSDFKDNYYCVCNEGWYGHQCEHQHVISNGIWIIAISILSVLTLLSLSSTIIIVFKM